jgi:hypothetical protein
MIGWLQGEAPARGKVRELLKQASRGETKVSASLPPAAVHPLCGRLAARVQMKPELTVATSLQFYASYGTI